MSTRYLRTKRLLLAVAAFALAAGLALLVNKLFGLKLEDRLSWRSSKATPEEEPQLFEMDERLGWRHKPGARTTQTEPEYKATYTIGSDGNRLVPGVPDSGPTVALLGCSFCFGLGVNDDEVFASVLQRDHWKTCRVRNFGCIGYTTSHALLCLEKEIRAGRKIDVAIYCWMWHHHFRNDRRRGWLKSLVAIQGKNPLYEMEGGRPVFKGLIGVDQSIDDNDPSLAPREERVTRGLLEAIQSLCKEHNIRLVVVMYPFPLESETLGAQAADKQMVSDCKSLGIPCLDLTGYSALNDPAAFYPSDHHPRASWHKTVARLIAEGTDPNTGRVRSSAPHTQDSRPAIEQKK